MLKRIVCVCLGEKETERDREEAKVENHLLRPDDALDAEASQEEWCQKITIRCSREKKRFKTNMAATKSNTNAMRSQELQ